MSAAPLPPSATPSPPVTIDGWYSLAVAAHIDRARWRAMGAESAAAREVALASAHRVLARLTEPPGDSSGWSMLVALTGSTSDVLIVHLRPTFDEVAAAHAALSRERLWDVVVPTFSLLGVAEVALYTLSLQLQEEARAQGGDVGDAAYTEALAGRLAAERTAPHVGARLHPVLPPDMPYVCFYPMSKRRVAPHNWYTLPLAERERLMRAHGQTGRRYRGRIAQIVTGATGFSAWEWGVTLFARDPLDIRHIVTDMRYDAVSADYAEFGEFFIGRRVDVATWLGAFG